MTDFPYTVYNSSGVPVMGAPEECRYPPKTEMSILEAGYAIRLNGKRITKADVRKRGEKK
jgi:hypothetical protein